MAYYDLKQKIPRFLSGFALQDGLGFKKMKSVEIFGNHKKLKNNKLSVV